MQGMFRANGGCGYVKKPNFLLKPNPKHDFFNPNEPLQPQKILKVKLFRKNITFFPIFIVAEIFYFTSIFEG